MRKKVYIPHTAQIRGEREKFFIQMLAKKKKIFVKKFLEKYSKKSD